MKTIRWVVKALACGVCVSAVAPSALAEAQRGVYLGVSAGKSSFDFEKDDFDDIVIDAFLSQGAPVLSGSSTLKDSDNTLSFLVGYRFLPYIAVEASYLDLGVAEYRSTGTVNPPGPVVSAPASLSMDIETKGFTLAGVGSLPIGRVVELHGRLGLLVSKTDLSVAATISSSTARDSDSLNSTAALLGVGLGLHPGAHWSLGLDWTRYANVGDENEDDDYETAEGFDVDAVSVSVAYRF